ncbi:MAG: sulfotransferase family protein [Rhizobiaceae bacterium]
MALEVIGAGLGRTGTLTLKTALERLGFGPCHHMVEVIAHPEQITFWNRVSDGEAVDWEEGYGAYRATVDWPGCTYYAELAKYYPEAKVILSRRDPERWYESMAETILASMVGMGLKHEVPADHPMRFGGIISDKTFGFDYTKENVIAAYERHNAEVVSTIAPERLLVYEVAQGWEPLCAHLGVPVPDEPFPHVNDREEFQAHAQSARDAAGR